MIGAWPIMTWLIRNRTGVLIGVMAIALAASHGWAYYAGRKAYAEICAAQKLADDEARQIAIMAAQNEAMIKIAQQQRITNEVQNDYQNKIADLRRSYDAEFERLRNSAEVHSDGATPAAAAPGVDHGAAAGNRLPRRTKEDLTRLMQKADEQTQRLIACQAWIARQAQP